MTSFISVTIPKPFLLAHRGASKYAPENTLPAFELALEQGADGVELDVKLSADGQPVVIHDAAVDRTTDGHGRVSELTLADLRSLDAGAKFEAGFRGTRIPTLAEVFEAIGARAVINVELTNYSTPFDGLVDKVCELVKAHGLQERILFSSFLGGNLVRARRLMQGSVPCGLLALPGWKGAWARSFGFMFGEYEALHPHYSDVTAQQVSRVHRLRRRIHVWTVNLDEDLARLNDWGVDGFITDDPLAARFALGRS